MRRGAGIIAYSNYVTYFRNSPDGGGDDNGYLLMILAAASIIVLVLLSVLAYLVFGRKGVLVTNKFAVLDNYGKQIPI